MKTIAIKKPELPSFDPFTKDPRILYEITRQVGDKKFASECNHERVKNGVCQDCFRRVI